MFGSRLRNVLALLLLVSPAAAFAMSCEPVSFTLQQAYDNSDAIVIAVASDCTSPDRKDEQTSGGARCSLATLEVLKPARSPRDYATIGQSAGCGLTFEVGRQYLLFLNESNELLPYSWAVENDRDPIGMVASYIEVLRDRREGHIDGLPEPWFFHGRDRSCVLFQHHGFERIVFHTSSIAPQLKREDWQLEQMGSQWVYRRTVEPGNEATGMQPRFSTVSSTMPNLTDQKHSLRVYLGDTRPAPDRLSVLSAGDTSWPLHQTRLRDYLGERMLSESVHYDAGEDIALAVLEKFEAGVDFSITARAVGRNALDIDSTNSRYTSGRAPEKVRRIDSKSHRIQPALERYRECLDRLDSTATDATK